MHLSKIMKKVGATVCAALSACTVFSSLSAATLTADAASISYSAPRKVTDIINSPGSTPTAVVNLMKGMDANYKKAAYSAIYTQNGSSNFVLVYKPQDLDLSNALKTSNAKAWTEKYAKYLTTLHRMTGVTVDYNVCVLNTDDPSAGGGAAGQVNDYRYFGQGCSMEIYTAIMSNKLTHALLHETSHGYLEPKATYNYGHTVFNSEEEVYVNLRALCALHWMKEDKNDIVLTDYTGKWTRTSGVNSKYQKSMKVRPMKESAYNKYIPSGSKLRNLDPKYTYVSEPQFVIEKGIDEDGAMTGANKKYNNRYFTRLGTILGYVASKPIWNSYNYDYNNANNWLNTDTINSNWNTISDSEWAMLSATCLTNVSKVQGDTTYTTAIVYAYNTYMQKVNTRMSYRFNGTTYTVKVTPRVKQWISENFSRTGDVFNISGSLIQAYNMMDLLNVNFYGARVKNKTIDMQAKEFYRTWFSEGAPGSGRMYPYTATKV